MAIEKIEHVHFWTTLYIMAGILYLWPAAGGLAGLLIEISEL